MIYRRPYSGNKFKPVVLTIAGYDPSGGAGVLADIKTFESTGVYGIAIITCNTYQNDLVFEGINWFSKNEKEKNMALLAERFQVKAAKLGMHKDLDDVLHSIKLCKKYFPDSKIIWDPVLAASAGFDLNIKIQKNTLNKILFSIFLVTPNQKEACRLGESKDADKGAIKLSEQCPTLLKGGHSSDNKASEDYLFAYGELKKTFPSARMKKAEKHGSGCVLSSAITASLAKGDALENAISKGKKYVTDFLKSNTTLLGYHLN
jgi:hydroxymethylpyrimidine/phosphomethylpyrimidine kinase